MAITLIYHHLDSKATDNISPFDKAIVSMVSGQDIKIACPYLSVDYLQRLFSLCKTWQILADVEAWIASHRHKRKRDELIAFISENSSQIRHLKKLHAKVISAGECTLVGSANFTVAGIQKRTEMSVLFENEPQVSEINSWYDFLWNQATPLKIEEIYEYARSIKNLETDTQLVKKTLTSYNPNIETDLMNLGVESDIDVTDEKFTIDELEDQWYIEEYNEDKGFSSEKGANEEDTNEEDTNEEDTNSGTGDSSKYAKSVHAYRLIPIAQNKFFSLKSSEPVNFNLEWITYKDYPECVKSEECLTTKYCPECSFFSLHECPIMTDPSIISSIRALLNQKEKARQEYIENQKIIINLIYDELKNLSKPIHYIELTENLAEQYPRLKLTPPKVLRTMNWYPEKFERVEKGMYKINV